MGLHHAGQRIPVAQPQGFDPQRLRPPEQFAGDEPRAGRKNNSSPAIRHSGSSEDPVQEPALRPGFAMFSIAGPVDPEPLAGCIFHPE
jgi:hypothetical protein